MSIQAKVEQTVPEKTEAIKRQLTAYLQICRVIGDAIRELGEVPSGELYAQVMQHVDLNTYEHVIATLIRSDVVTKTSHLLKWVGTK